MAREVGLAGLLRIRLFTARKLCVKPLDSLKKHLHFCHRTRVVLRRLGAARIRLPAHLALLARANILGPVVSLSQALAERFEFLQG